MTVKSHVLTSISIGVMLPIMLYPHILDSNSIYLYIFGVIFGALLPDIDESHSYIGKRLYLISLPLNKLIGHRTLTHNIFIYALIIYLGYHYHYHLLLITGIAVGAILHILEDSVTKSGVKWALKPILNKFVLLPRPLRFSTGGKFENFVYIPIITLIVGIQALYIGIYLLRFFPRFFT